ncbi:hypothetical protein AB6N24_05555 [Cellulomonas sp. 179-A 4D5 NHS]|uniref:hypothetical protein n=1 Tax=Cellulomonas sp. 179-A 4D5 NHS TaxID=3142378 RepID=UPI0039A112F2
MVDLLDVVARRTFDAPPERVWPAALLDQRGRRALTPRAARAGRARAEAVVPRPGPLTHGTQRAYFP